MSDNDLKLAGSRILDACITLLLASMALYGTVLIVQAIWIYLCIALAVIGLIVGIVWFLRTRF